MSKLLGAFLNKAYPMAKYTIVGNPTITKGVVSGFSSANYLSIPYPTNLQSFEIQVDFTTGNDISGTQGIIGQLVNYNYTTPQLSFSNNGSLFFGYGNNGSWISNTSISGYHIQANTNYIAKLIWKNKKIISVIQNDNETLSNSVDAENVDWVTNLLIGKDQSSAFKGSIKINNIYIKVNNKLWFNGQPA